MVQTRKGVARASRRSAVLRDDDLVGSCHTRLFCVFAVCAVLVATAGCPNEFANNAEPLGSDATAATDVPDGAPTDATTHDASQPVDLELISDAALRPSRYQEAWRPQFHFTSERGWLNDPSGLVVLDGFYHLFYQHRPDIPQYGPMHWGHAVSQDLVYWDHRPVALYPDPILGWAFTGSAVLSQGAEICSPRTMETACMVLVFTHHGGADGTQKQSIAYSADSGETFTLLTDNPVLPNPGDAPDFRDPKVLWDEARARWVMVLAEGREVGFYTSEDLLQWTLRSRFSAEGISDEGALECPDLFRLTVEGSSQAAWVLKVDLNRGFASTRPSAFYWTGDFDGQTFVPSSISPRLVDYGADFYAAQSWFSLSDDTRIWIAWMNNWGYALRAPTEDFRGSMTVPRVVSLVESNVGDRNELLLAQRPAPSLADLRRGPLVSLPEPETLGAVADVLNDVAGNALWIDLTLEPADAQTIGLAIHVGDGEQTVVGFERDDQGGDGGLLFVDRSANTRAHLTGGGRHEAPVSLVDGRLTLTVLVDAASVEVFTADGSVVVTDLVFPELSSDRLGVVASPPDSGGRMGLTVYALDTIWPE